MNKKRDTNVHVFDVGNMHMIKELSADLAPERQQ